MDEDKESSEEKKGPIVNKWVAFAFLIAVVIFMYTSIMYKIMVYGP